MKSKLSMLGLTACLMLLGTVAKADRTYYGISHITDLGFGYKIVTCEYTPLITCAVVSAGGVTVYLTEATPDTQLEGGFIQETGENSFIMLSSESESE